MCISYLMENNIDITGNIEMCKNIMKKYFKIIPCSKLGNYIVNSSTWTNGIKNIYEQSCLNDASCSVIISEILDIDNI